ncbi:usherin-like isoform X2 [Puntigrus tetrazona]|uniref:usherin-like isoform X2 n=1 Tax=Puntigrus tetrazona TaxID=1606681 RepID=UPI001C898D36|nr:usherin-like isoform X2 [Puntigrus tetrazona]
MSTPDGDISPFSEPVVITPEQLETRLKPPRELCVMGSTATQVRLCWIEPEEGARPKSYHIYCNDSLVKTTALLGATVGSLSPGTSYRLSVSSLGPGDTESPRAVTEVKTAEDQDHAPSAVTVVVLGRHELQINWGAPVAPLGRLFRYELSLNGCVVYLGTGRSYTACRLNAYTAYTCIVTALTSRGRCQSSPVTKKTHRYLHSHKHQSASKHSSPSSSIQVTSEIKKNETLSAATLSPKILPHGALDHRKDRHRQTSVQICSPKGDLSSAHTSKEHSDYMFQTPEDLRHFRAKISPVRLQWNLDRKVPIDRKKLPSINKLISEDVRPLQPVSFSWSNLEWTEQHQNRPHIDRNKTVSKVQSQQRGRRHQIPS